MSTSFKTDFYELTMVQAAFKSGAAIKKATFELFARKLPAGRKYGVVIGTYRAIEAIQNFHFNKEQIAYLKEHTILDSAFLEWLENYKFSGTVTGYEEGDVCFPNSPILTVEGTFAEAVLLETVLLSIFNYDSAVGAAASRMVEASEGLFPLIEMGSRRTHEDGAVSASRAAYICGFTASSNIEAGMRYGIPITGTAAHAFTLAHANETEAFTAQINTLGVNTTLLVDTYDIENGIKTAIKVAGKNLGAIRIDSGDLHDEPNNARKLLDSLGAVNTKIVVSSDIDEYSIAELVERGTPINGVGAGTRVVTGSGHPTCGMVYKLVEIEDENGEMRSLAKKSASKKSVGGLKTVYREYDKDGLMVGEYFTVRKELDETNAFKKVQKDFIVDGIVQKMLTIDEIREFHKKTMLTLPKEAKTVTAGDPLTEIEEIVVMESVK